MLTRRQFFIGTGAALTTALIAKYASFIELTGEPYLTTTTKTKHVLYILRDNDFMLSLDEIPENLTTIPLTWQEHLDAQHFTICSTEEYQSLVDEYRAKHSLDEPVDLETYLDYGDNGYRKAFNLLEALDIGSQQSVDNNLVGGITFHKGFYPGDNSVGVTCDDDLSVSLLQHTLNRLGLGIEVQIGNFV